MSKFNSNAQALLNAISEEIRKTGRTDLAAAIDGTKKRAVETVEFFRKNMNSSVGDVSGKFNLVKETGADDILEGARSIGRGRLPQGTIMAITKLSLEYGRSTTVTNSAEIDFSNLIYSDVATKAAKVPTKLLNAKFRLFHGSNIVCQGLVKDYFKAHDIENNPGLGSDDSSVYKEISPIYIADDQGKFDLEIELPQTGNMGATFIHHLGFRIGGLVIMDR